MNSVSPIDTLVDWGRLALVYLMGSPNSFKVPLDSVGGLKTGPSMGLKGLAGQFGHP